MCFSDSFFNYNVFFNFRISSHDFFSSKEFLVITFSQTQKVLSELFWFCGNSQALGIVKFPALNLLSPLIVMIINWIILSSWELQSFLIPVANKGSGTGSKTVFKKMDNSNPKAQTRQCFRKRKHQLPWKKPLCFVANMNYVLVK